MDHDTVKTGPKDVFLQLLVIVTLYLSATHLGVLLFQIINRAFPDAADNALYTIDAIAGTARWAIATLVVTAPVFFGLTHYLRKEYAAHPEKLAMRTRRWLIAFTLFAAALVAIGDLVTVVYQFLGGDITTRFLLKALTILIIAGAVLVYERWEFARTSDTEIPARMLALRWGSIVVTIATIIAGFLFVGSPAAVRRNRLDRQRVNDLNQIQWEVVRYWQQKDALPPSLDALRDDLTGFVPPIDPETKQEYAYRVLGERVFEICGTFFTASDDPRNAMPTRYPTAYPTGPSDAAFDTWKHGVGQTCFERTIDPTKYRSMEETPSPRLK